MDKRWDNPTCNSCHAQGNDYDVDFGDGEKYCVCGECCHNPILKSTPRSSIIPDTYDDDDWPYDV